MIKGEYGDYWYPLGGQHGNINLLTAEYKLID